MGAETDEQCRDMLERLTVGETEIGRNRVLLKIEKIINPVLPLRDKKTARRRSGGRRDT